VVFSVCRAPSSLLSHFFLSVHYQCAPPGRTIFGAHLRSKCRLVLLQYGHIFPHECMRRMSGGRLARVRYTSSCSFQILWLMCMTSGIRNLFLSVPSLWLPDSESPGTPKISCNNWPAVSLMLSLLERVSPTGLSST
jgi:hypothetical protein